MFQRKWLLGAGLLVLITATVFALWFFVRADPAVAELRQMSEKVFDRNLPDTERDALRDDFRKRVRSLSDAEREAFFDGMRGRWMARIEQRMDEFFAMSPAEQQQRLDEILDRMNQPRPERREGRGRGGRGNWGNLTEAQRDERSKRRLDRTSPKLRAQFSEFRRRLEDRAQERGMAVRGWGKGRRG